MSLVLLDLVSKLVGNGICFFYKNVYVGAKIGPKTGFSSIQKHFWVGEFC